MPQEKGQGFDKLSPNGEGALPSAPVAHVGARGGLNHAELAVAGNAGRHLFSRAIFAEAGMPVRPPAAFLALGARQPVFRRIRHRLVGPEAMLVRRRWIDDAGIMPGAA